MMYDYLTPQAVTLFIESALREDVGEGDHSTLASVPENTQNQAQLLIKGHGIIAGVDLATRIFRYVDANLELETFVSDGDAVQFGKVGFIVQGKAQSILKAERLILNCMQRMSGIATYTSEVVSLLEDTNTRILDTRKTTPNFRLCEKWAVRIGGGQNHRFGLFDMIMLKDNHIDYAGGITQAVQNTVDYLERTGKKLRIEVETRNLEEVEEALRTNQVDVIMLDNMSPSTMKMAVELINGACQTEASGGITEETIQEVAQCGVDFISMGALTHSVKSMDISLKAF